MLRNLMLIVNPYSGRGLTKSALGGIVMQLCEGGCSVTVYTPGSGGLEQLAREYGGAYDLIVCVGGDGTLSGVISGLLDISTPPPVGYIPSGTANDVATTLALSKNPVVAAQKIISGNPVPLDIGRIGDMYFTYIAAFGAFTDVSYSTPQSAKKTFGHLAYVLGGLASVPEIKERHVVVEYDDGVIEGDYIFGGVTNSTSVAGFVRLDPERVKLADGLFEIILIKRPIALSDLIDVLSSVMRQRFDGDNVLMFQSSRVKFTFDEEVMWTRDGEDGGAHRELEITNCHEAIRIIL